MLMLVAALDKGGLPESSWATLAAIAYAENDKFLIDAKGDEGIQTDKWGPSVGLFQIRTLKDPAKYGEPHRDIKWLLVGGDQAIANQVQAAKIISGGGKSFIAWSTYGKPKYLGALNNARTVVSHYKSLTPAQKESVVPKAGQWGQVPGPGDVAGELLDPFADVLGAIAAVANALIHPMGWFLRVMQIVGGGALVGGGATLLARDLSPTSAVAKVAKKTASAANVAGVAKKTADVAEGVAQ